MFCLLHLLLFIAVVILGLFEPLSVRSTISSVKDLFDV